MSLRPTLRTAVLVAAAIGAVLVPSAAAVADSTPTAAPAEAATPTPASGDAGRPTAATPAPASGGAERPSAAPVPADSVRPGTMPRGGVAAGELPTGNSGDTADTALYGSAAGIALLAGAGVLVLRRRSAAQR
ncbi:hypothetical protein [Streptomyces sp. NPDC057287]|uniref:hypothetical protein n=1 Tax=Streptomyces sp. NPDC057287 TaxID=3346086 RepID=UPI00362544BB